MDQQILIVLVLGVVCLAAVGFFVFAPTDKDRTKKRLSGLELKKNARRAGAVANDAAQQKDRRRRVNEALAKVDNQAKERKKKPKLSLEQRFEQAGLAITPPQFYIGSLISAGFLGAVGFVSGQTLPITGGLVIVGGLGLPRWFIGFATKRRQKKFENEFSNAIDVIVRGVKSGLPVNECLKIIATEAPAPVCDEFHQLTEGIKVGLSLDQGLERMYDRMPLQEVNFFGIVLMIQQKTGGNLAEALGNLSNVLRQRKLMDGKIKAYSAEAKASAMIIGSLPFLVMGAVKVASPDYLEPLFSTQQGNFIMLGAGLWMSIGIMVMRKMIQIKV